MVSAKDFLRQIEQLGVRVVAGVPDSTLKAFCDELQTYPGMKKYVAANEGAAVGAVIGAYLATGTPGCVYMQNSGIGNMVNPFTSLAHGKIYGIPMVFVIGWRGEPGTRDEPQHAFQGEVTLDMLRTLQIPCEVIDEKATAESLHDAMGRCGSEMRGNGQFAFVVKKGALAPDGKYAWENGNTLIREEVLGEFLRALSPRAALVSTTGKISRELYEQSGRILGNHDSIFMTVGGMGHASMIAFGIAQEAPERWVACIDGDGAALMHMGAIPFIASHAPRNFIHILVNNMAHESVGAMPTDCRGTDFAAIARAAGYAHAERISTEDELAGLRGRIFAQEGPAMYEVLVSLGSRPDLGRPAETPGENKQSFMKFLGVDAGGC